MCWTYEEVIASHTGLAGDSSGDDDKVRVLESGLGAIVGGEESLDLGGRRDVREVGSDLG